LHPNILLCALFSNIWNLKNGKVYSLEYTKFSKVFFTP
jgi:hypothetical protein